MAKDFPDSSLQAVPAHRTGKYFLACDYAEPGVPSLVSGKKHLEMLVKNITGADYVIKPELAS
jgi:hypothetical protein